MISKDELLQAVTEYYLTSYDFNGIPNYQLPEFFHSDLEELVEEEKVFILSESEVNNIHLIKSISEILFSAEKNIY